MNKEFPNFIVGGAPRSATTWLYAALDLHHDIFMAKPVTPEPKFFLVDSEYEKGLEHYKKYFTGRKAEKACGEKSTNYLESATTAERIHQVFPDMKFIFMLREPVSRAFDNYLWSKSNGVEDKNFEEALSLENEREENLSERFRFARPHAYFSRGCYASLLKPYIDLFSLENILCVPMEEITQKPYLRLKAIHRFLGVAEDLTGIEELGVINRAKIEAQQIAPETEEKLKKAYIKHNNELAALVGEKFQGWCYE